MDEHIHPLVRLEQLISALASELRHSQRNLDAANALMLEQIRRHDQRLGALEEGYQTNRVRIESLEHSQVQIQEIWERTEAATATAKLIWRWARLALKILVASAGGTATLWGFVEIVVR